MPTLKLTLEYDGSGFAGFQAQPGERTVQQVLEQALHQLLGEPTKVTGAGRTDAGVHAAGQVVSLRTERELPLRAYVRGLGSLLPPDLSVTLAEEVPEGFDARRWASGKRYEYRIWNGAARSALRERGSWTVFRPLDVAAMREAAAHLVGEHDFRALRAASCCARTTVRTMFKLELSGESGGELTLVAEATAFLQHMVRNLVGTLVEVGHGRRQAASMPAFLAAGDRTAAGRTAPPHGLTLVRVYYDDPSRFSAPEAAP